MTIKIERDAILSLSPSPLPASPDSPSHCYPPSVSNSSSSSSSGSDYCDPSSCHQTDDKSYFFELAGSKLDPQLQLELKAELHYQHGHGHSHPGEHVNQHQPPELDDTDDESTVSSNSCTTTASTAKGVTFCEPLVTEVRFRPKTLKRNLRLLFYTYEETQRFRQEYREERRLKAQEEADSASSTCHTASTSSGDGTAKSVWDGFSGQNIDKSTRSNHRISKVVVLHKNTLETFIDKEMDISNIGGGGGGNGNGNGNVNSSSSSSHHSSSQNSTHPGKCQTASDDFFDNDSFWSGQITWY